MIVELLGRIRNISSQETAEHLMLFMAGITYLYTPIHDTASLVGPYLVSTENECFENMHDARCCRELMLACDIKRG